VSEPEIMSDIKSLQALAAALAAPFPASVVGWKPQTIKDRRAMVVAYIDARDVMDRLDAVLGPLGWQDSYECLPDGCVVCRLQLRLDGEWVVREDVGSPSGQPDVGDRRKAAFSDALKRAAVKFGVGRYIYRLDQQWVDYDPQKKRVMKEPTLPAWALPTPEPGPSPRVLVPPPADSAPETRERGQGEPVNEGPAPQSRQTVTPSLGERFLARLLEKEAELILAKLAREGELIQHIRECGAQVGLPEDLRQWSFGEVRVAGGWVQAFEEGASKARASTSERLSQEEIDRAASLLAQKGRHFRDVAKGVRVKVNTRLEDLSRAQCERLLALLGALPDAKEEPAPCPT
jgi:hypothetical protein